MLISRLKIILTALLLFALVYPTVSSGEDKYYEDVQLLAFGRCRSVFDFPHPIHVGGLDRCGIGIEDTSYEKVYVFINGKPETILDNHIIFMHDGRGVFIWGQVLPFARRYRPPIVFMKCHADRLWIYERY